MQDIILILDFGGQYVFNIRRCLLEQGFKAEIVPFNVSIKKIKEINPKGIILSGGPYSVYENNSPKCSKEILKLNVPVLGICYGHQLLAYFLGCKVAKGLKGEYGFSELEILKRNPLFTGLNNKEICWMSHKDLVNELSENCEVLASTEESKIAAFSCERKFFGLQFHPEVFHTPNGHKILKNFASNICGCKEKKWEIENFLENKILEIKNLVADGKAVTAVSGGVDSTLAAVIASKALNNKLICVHVNTGLLRKNESENVIRELEEVGLKVKYVDISKKVLKEIKEIKNSNEKRLFIGKIFIKEFERIAKEEGAKWLIQGTIAPDIIESTRGMAEARKGIKHGGFIKIHHNVGGLPKNMELKLIEPLSTLFKYQVRELGKKIGLPKKIIWRQPFPGPGLACRILGEVNKEKIELLREITDVVEKELKKYKPSQYFAALVDNNLKLSSVVSEKVSSLLKKEVQCFIFKNKAVGVKGDQRILGNILGIKDEIETWIKTKWLNILKMQNKITGVFKDICRVVIFLNSPSTKKYGVILRAVDTLDFMTAIPTEISFKHLSELALNIANKQLEVGFIGYEVTSKPPATIELI